LTRRATSDISAIHSFIASESPGRAQTFIERITAQFRILASHPRLGRPRPEFALMIRSTAVKPVVIFHQYIAEEDYVEIVRVVDGRRDLRTIFAEDV